MTLDKHLQKSSSEIVFPIYVVSNENAPRFTNIPFGVSGEVINYCEGKYTIRWHSTNVTEILNGIGTIATCLEVKSSLE